MYIPTKLDFINDRNKAHGDLYFYICALFNKNPYEDDVEDIQELSLRFFENNKLSGFFDEFGEIIGNEQQFKIFCEKEIKQFGNGETSFIFGGYVGADGEDEQDYFSYENDKLQFEEYQQQVQSDSFDESEKVDIEKLKNYLENLVKKIEELSAVEQARFKVAYLAIQNTLDISAKKAPTDMPKEARIAMQEKAKGVHIKYDEKRKVLEDVLYPTGFWQKYHEMIGKNLLNKEFKIQNEIYIKLYKRAKFSNGTRDKKKMSALVDLVNANLGNDIREKIKKDIRNFLCRTSLTPIPAEAQSDKDIALSKEKKVVRSCRKFVEFISMFVQESVGNSNTPKDLNWEEKVAAYIIHRSKCEKCRMYENQLRRWMEYRESRIRAIGNQPPYPYHEYNPKQVKRTAQKDLVLYYEREYRQNPCDMNLFYLLLVYKKAGEMQKAKILLESTKGIHEYQEVKKTVVATQIQGASLC